jgi:S-adenosylmethionine-diacylglycerol 3-amino-3-carboxypropyl transferase
VEWIGVVEPLRAESHARLKEAIRRNPVLSRDGLLERLFERLFRGLVYTQIWEDPEIDLEALALTPDCHIVAIASGGCNVLSYLSGDPARITAVDLSRAHVALVRLKLAAATRLPSWQAFYRFFGAADDEANIAAYQRLVAPYLDDESRAYWDGRTLQHLGRRRISIFARNAYHHGVLGRFIGIAHAAARFYGVDRASQRADVGRAAPFLRDGAGAAVRQAGRALGNGQPCLALWARHSTRAV